jgi:hypothetical protein
VDDPGLLLRFRRSRSYSVPNRARAVLAAVPVTHCDYLDLRAVETATIEVTGLPDDVDPADIEVRAWQAHG